MENSIQTIVVHVNQLTPENMLQLGQAGYRVIRDPDLLIFGRNLNPQEQQQATSDTPAAIEGEVVTPVATTPTSIHSTTSNKKTAR